MILISEGSMKTGGARLGLFRRWGWGFGRSREARKDERGGARAAGRSGVERKGEVGGPDGGGVGDEYRREEEGKERARRWVAACGELEEGKVLRSMARGDDDRWEGLLSLATFDDQHLIPTIHPVWNHPPSPTRLLPRMTTSVRSRHPSRLRRLRYGHPRIWPATGIPPPLPPLPFHQLLRFDSGVRTPSWRGCRGVVVTMICWV
jgi:hypothetical protein